MAPILQSPSPSTDEEEDTMKIAVATMACALTAIPLAAAPQKDKTASAPDANAIVLRGCVVPGENSGTYVMTHVSEVAQAGRSAMPDEAHGRRVVFWLDRKSDMLKHQNKAVTVKGSIVGYKDSEIELKNGDTKDGDLLAEFEGPGKDVKVPNQVVGDAVGTSGRTTAEKNDVKTMLVKVKVSDIQETSDYSCSGR
jgi:hypothetical protein